MKSFFNSCLLCSPAQLCDLTYVCTVPVEYWVSTMLPWVYVVWSCTESKLSLETKQIIICMTKQHVLWPPTWLSTGVPGEHVQKMSYVAVLVLYVRTMQLITLTGHLPDRRWQIHIGKWPHFLTVRHYKNNQLTVNYDVHILFWAHTFLMAL